MITFLKPRKAGTFMDIPTKQMKDVCEVLCEPISRVLNKETDERRMRNPM